MNLWRAVTFLGHSSLALALQAQEPAANLQLSGFGTLGLVATGTHKVGFVRDATEAACATDHPASSVDSRLGVQWSSRLPGDLLWTLQVVSKNNYDNTSRPQVPWACLTWNPGPDWQIKAGRMGLEVLPDGDFANVGYAYLWVRPPVEAFGAMNVKILDGLDLIRSFERPNGTTYQMQMYGGFADEKEPVDDPQANVYDLSGSYIWGVALKARRGGFRSRLSYSQVQLLKEYGGAKTQAFRDVLASFSTLLHDPRPAQVADQLRLQGTTVRVILLGCSWERDQIQAQASVSRTLIQKLGFQNSWNGFASFGYRIGSLVPYAVWARAVSDRNPTPDLGPLASLPGLIPKYLVQAVDLAAHSRETDQSTWSAGVRWDFTGQAALKFQVDRVRAHNSSGFWRVLEPGWDGKATVMSVTLDFIFGRVR